MNLAAMRAAVARRSGVDYDATALNEVLNEALQAIAAEHDWPWQHTSGTFATVAGTGTQAVPASWVRTIDLQIDDYQPMQRFSRSELEARWPDDDDRGRPSEFAVDDTTIILRPVPDAAYTVQHTYVITETTLSGDSDTPELPAQYHSAVVEFATAQVLDRAGQAGRAERAMKNYRDWLDRIRSGVRLERGPHRVRVRAGSQL